MWILSSVIAPIFDGGVNDRQIFIIPNLKIVISPIF